MRQTRHTIGTPASCDCDCPNKHGMEDSWTKWEIHTQLSGLKEPLQKEIRYQFQTPPKGRGRGGHNKFLNWQYGKLISRISKFVEGSAVWMLLDSFVERVACSFLWHPNYCVLKNYKKCSDLSKELCCHLKAEPNPFGLLTTLSLTGIRS